ncbi:MAG: hypothetical protein QM644_13365 [Mobilitalea sp.]
MSLLERLFNKKRQNSDREKSVQENEAAKDFETDETDSIVVQSADSEEKNEAVVYDIVEREILPAKIICPDCGGITIEGLEFCDKCGGELI